MDRKAPEAARNFAARFFGVAPEAVTTVGEDYEAETWAEPRSVPPAPSEDPAGLLDRYVRAVEDEDGSGSGIRAVWRSLAGKELREGAHPGSGIGDAEEGRRPGAEGAGGWPEALYAALSCNELVFRLNEELETPRALDELPPALERHVGRPVTEAEILIWLTLGAAARHEGRPLLRPVVHGFVRGIGGTVVSFPEDAGGPRLWLAAEDEAGPAEPLDGERERESPTSAAALSMSGPAGEPEGDTSASQETGEGQERRHRRPARATPGSRSPPASGTTTLRFSRTSASPARGRAAATPAPRAPDGSLWTKRWAAGASSSSIA